MNHQISHRHRGWPAGVCHVVEKGLKQQVLHLHLLGGVACGVHLQPIMAKASLHPPIQAGGRGNEVLESHLERLKSPLLSPGIDGIHDELHARTPAVEVVVDEEIVLPAPGDLRVREVVEVRVTASYRLDVQILALKNPPLGVLVDGLDRRVAMGPWGTAYGYVYMVSWACRHDGFT